MVLFLFSSIGKGQDLDSIPSEKLNYNQLVVPASMITAGVLSHQLKPTQRLHERIDYYRYMWVEDPLRFDDYTQFAPITAALFLDKLGVHAKHSRKDRFLQAGVGLALTLGTVYGLKGVIHVQRPNLRSYDSFPSGHTALAFLGADMVRREYGESSPWYGITAYAVASVTGFMRMYNDKHWLGDVVGGAGIGIFISHLSNWLVPKLFPHLRKEIDDMGIKLSASTDGAGLCWRF